MITGPTLGGAPRLERPHGLTGSVPRGLGERA